MGKAKITGGGAAPMRNGEIILLPAYDEDIRPNTFVSITGRQARSNEVILDSALAGDSSELGDLIGGRSFELSSGRRLFIYARKYSLWARVITRTCDGIYDSGTAVKICTWSFSETYGGSLDLCIARGEGNKFVAHIRQSSGSQISACLATFKIDSSYEIKVMAVDNDRKEVFAYGSNLTVTSSAKDGMVDFTHCGNDLFLLNGYRLETSFGLREGYSISAIYKLDAAGNFVRTNVIDESSRGSVEHVCCAGFIDDGRPILVRNSSHEVQLAEVGGTGISVITRTDFGDSLYGTPSLIHLGDGKYAMFAATLNSGTHGFKVYLFTASADSIVLNSSWSEDDFTRNGVKPETLVWEEENSYLYAMYTGQWTTPVLLIFQIDKESMSVIDRISTEWDITSCFGAQLVGSGIVEGIANSKFSTTDVQGIGRWDINTLQQCVRNSLDTNVITGVTLGTCTRQRPNKVCILRDTTVATAYGIAEPVVDMIKNDAIEEIQQEVSKDGKM